jgi:uncharacterized LabA/DUF88 family protein
MPEKRVGQEYISLQEATKYCPYSQEYLSLRARQGKLKALKIGRNWVTTREWIEDYLKKVEDYDNNFKVSKTAAPPENLPVTEKTFSEVITPRVDKAWATSKIRFGVALALISLLIIAGGIFGKESFQNVFRQANSYLITFNQEIDKEISNGWQGLQLRFQEIGQEVDRGVAGGLTELNKGINSVGDLVGERVEEISKDASNGIQGIGRAGNSFSERIVRSLEDSLAAVSEDVSQFSQDFSQFGSEVIFVVGKTIALTLAGINQLASAIQEIPGLIANITKDIGWGIGQGLAGVGQGISQGLKGISQGLGEIAKEIEEGRRVISQTGSGLALALWQGIDKGLAGVVEGVKGIGQGIKDISSGLGQGASEFWQFVTQPFKKEIVVKEEKVEKEVISEEVEKEIAKLSEELRKLKTEGLPAKEIIREVSKEVTQITKVEPIQEITKETIKIDEKTLAEVRASISDIESRTSSLESRANQAIYYPTIPYIVPAAPIREIQTGNVNLSASNNLELSGNPINLRGNTNVLGSLTVGTSTLTIDSAGNLTTTGTITATGTITEAGTPLALKYVSIPSGSAQGDIFIRDALGWTRLAAGTSGQFLQTQGALANPIWTTVSLATAGGWTDDGVTVRLETITDSVGIGTTTPGTYKLAVSGTTNLTGNTDIGGNLTISGAITSGAWQGTAIATQYGGTGQNWSAIAQGSIPYFSATGTMSALAPGTAGQALLSGGAGANPYWGQAGVNDASYVVLGLHATLTAERVLTAGSGLSLTDGGANGNVTLTLGNLTADWTNTGAFNILTAGNIGILEGGLTPTLYGILDVADLSTADKTYTFPDASGTVALGTGTANYAAYWSATNTLAAEQYLAVSRGGTGAGTLNDLITLGTHTTGNYVATTSGTSPISVSGSGVETAAITISCPTCVTSTGGGTTLFTLAGSAGTPQTISTGDTLTIAAGTNITTTAGATDTVTVATVANPTFATSVTTPLLTTSSGDLTIDPAGRVGFGGSPWFGFHVKSSDGVVVERPAGEWFYSLREGGRHRWMLYYPSGGGFAIRQGYNAAGTAVILDRVVISDAGNVGIGTTGPQQKLTLGSGSNYATEMAVPSSPAATATTGGTLTAGTYYYKVVATDGVGTTTGSSEVSCTVDGTTTNACQISWTAVTGASSYRIYGRATEAQNQYWTSASSPYTDTGTAGTAGTVPTVNTAYVTKLTASGNSWLLGGNVGIGTTAPAAPLHVTGQCVTGDTRLRRRRRRRKSEIRNPKSETNSKFLNSKFRTDDEYVYDEVQIKDIQPGDEILSLNEKTGEFEYQKVKGLLDMGVQEIYELKTESGKTIKTTGNHPYLALAAGWDKFSQKPKAGVFIDDANMFYAQKRMGWRIDYRKLKEVLSQDFEVQFMNYYLAIPQPTDQPTFYKTQKFLSKLGYKGSLIERFEKHPLEFTQLWQRLQTEDLTIITKPLKYIPEKIHFGDSTVIERVNKKGDIDVDITIDVLNSLKNLDVIIILSGDSDFVKLREEVLEKGKKITFLSSNDNLAVELRRGKFFILERMKNFIQLGAENKKAPDTLRGTLLSLLYAKQEPLSRAEPVWTKVAYLSIGDEIAVFDELTQSKKFEKIISLKKVGKEQVFDIEVEGTHNFVGNDIVAHNTFLATTSGNVGIGTGTAETLLTLRKSSAGNVLAIRNTGDTANTFTITDAGIVNLGTWQGTAIATQYGGTGQNWSAVAAGSLPYFSGAGTMGTLAIGAANTILTSSGTAPQWSTSITVTDLTCTNCLDFAEFEDILDLDAALTLNQSTNTWVQNFTGTTTTGFTYKANSLTAGTGIYIANDSGLSTFTSGVLLNLYELNDSSFAAQNRSGNMLNIKRENVQYTNALTISGAVVAISSARGYGIDSAYTDTSSLLSLSQTCPSIANCSGPMLDITGTLRHDTANTYGLRIRPTFTDDALPYDYGFYNKTTYSGTNASGAQVHAAYNELNITNQSSANWLSGFGHYVYLTTGTFTAGTLNVYGQFISKSFTTAPTNVYGTYIGDMGATGVTSSYGLYIEDQTLSTNSYGIYVAGGDTYALWIDSDKSRFDGPVAFGAQQTLTANSTTPSVSGGSHFITANTSATLYSNFTSGETGQIIFIEINDANTDFDCTGTNLKCGATDITIPAAGDIFTFIYDGTNWNLIQWMDVSATQSGADIAEMFVSSEELEPGDVVVIDSNQSARIRKSTQAYDSKSLGIVSTAPGIVLGESETENTYHAYPIALVGKVPVKVSTENGPIGPGDPLTSSSTPGVAMKATKAGPIVGKALEPLEQCDNETMEQCKIMVFVNVSYYLPTENLERLSPEDEASPTFVDLLFSDITRFFKEGLAKLGLFIENGVAQVRELFADRIKTKELCIEEGGEEVCINKDQLKELLEKSQNPNVMIIDTPAQSPPEEEVPTEEAVEGCMNPEASNYIPEATVEDGSCQHPEPEPELMPVEEQSPTEQQTIEGEPVS